MINYEKFQEYKYKISKGKWDTDVQNFISKTFRTDAGIRSFKMCNVQKFKTIFPVEHNILSKIGLHHWYKCIMF